MCQTEDPRVQRSKTALIDALLDLTQRSAGLNAVSVKDITQAAGVNRSTFYAHYSDKYALFDDAVRHKFGEALRAALPRPHQFALADMPHLVRQTGHFLKQVTGHCKPVAHDINVLVETQVQRLLETYLCRAFTENTSWAASLTASPQTSATLLSWAVFGGALAWSRGSLPDDLDALAQQLTRLVQRGMVAELASVAD